MKFAARFIISKILCLSLFLNINSISYAQSSAVAITPPENNGSWTMEEALGQLQLFPHDTYLQYVALQLARRNNKLDEVRSYFDAFNGRIGRSREDIDLFSIFTGALAVQESLQLEKMLGESRARLSFDEAMQPPGPKPVQNKIAANASPEEKQSAADIYQWELQAWQQQQEAYQSFLKRKQLLQQKRVQVSSLTGPTIKSHPWAEMLKGRQPELSPLSRIVPSDFYFAEFRSLTKLLDAAANTDLWSTHLFNQTSREAFTHNTAERLKQQLAIETNPLMRPFYDLVVESIGLTGSDLFLREGSDVTMLLKLKQPAIARAQLDNFLANAEKKTADVKRTTGNYLGIEYVQLASPDRSLSVISAWPLPDLHIRSNSRAAFEKVIAAMQGKDDKGKVVERLGDTQEFAYIRTLMPRGAAEEDGLIYLSDPFIRHLIGPQLKLTEQRRIHCYNHLRMIGHAALLYQTERGKAPDSLATLAETKCSPGLFGTGELTCPAGGNYSLAQDGFTGVCSHHGNARSMTPCLEIPVNEVSGYEAADYQDFLNEYNQYWRTYFDPIALRVKLSPEQYRLETIVLPLIDNSIYTGLASVLGGEPEPLDALPVPQRNIFSLGVRLHKEKWLRSLEETLKNPDAFRSSMTDPILRDLGLLSTPEDTKRFYDLLAKGVGNQLALHIYDSQQTFDLNLPNLFGFLFGSIRPRSGSLNLGSFELIIGAVIAAFNSPIYLSIPINDARIVDEFLTRLDSQMAYSSTHRQSNRLDFGRDFYRRNAGSESSAEALRTFVLRFGPVSLRLFWARIGNGLFIASKPFIIEDLVAAKNNQPVVAASEAELTKGHAMVRLRPLNWNRVLPDFQLGWAENNREACLRNLSAIASASRAFAPASTSVSREARSQQAHAAANRFFTVNYFCPDGGQYLLAETGWQAECSLHGSKFAPRQMAAPDPRSDLGKLLKEFSGLMTTLTFTEDGLRAVVTIERK